MKKDVRQEENHRQKRREQRENHTRKRHFKAPKRKPNEAFTLSQPQSSTAARPDGILGHRWPLLPQTGSHYLGQSPIPPDWLGESLQFCLYSNRFVVAGTHTHTHTCLLCET